MLDPHGFVATCNSTHFFVVKGTPDEPEVWTSDGRFCLGGITRGNVLAMCRAHGITAHEKTFSLTDVYSAQEAFVTGTFAGVAPVPVGRRPHHRIGRARPGGDPAAGAVRRLGGRRRRRAVSAMTEVRVAMWSGPRNISTAMMRAWENRPDTVVVDEPLYAAYLSRTGLDHPGRDEVIAAQPTSLDEAVAELLRAAARRRHRPLRQAHGPPPRHRADAVVDRGVPQRAADPRPGRGGRLLRPLARGLRARRHRAAPAAVAASSAGTRPASTSRSSTPPTSSSDPEAHLRWLCDWLGIDFTDRMLGLAARPARLRRRVGAALVRRRAGLDRLRAVPAPRGGPLAARRRGGRGLPAGVRRAPGAGESDHSRLRQTLLNDIQ